MKIREYGFRERTRTRITSLFEQTGEHYLGKGLATYELHQGRDVHAFLMLARDPRRIVHLQGYPGMSSEESARVFARIMDHQRVVEMREGGSSIGGEHDATLFTLPGFHVGLEVSYESAYLRERLEENIPELR